MILTDFHGVEHTVTNCNNDKCFFRAAMPFDGNNITDDATNTDYKAPGGGFWKRASALSETVVIEYHTSEDQAAIRKVAIERGIREANLDQTHVLLLIPYSFIESIKFTGQDKGERKDGQAKSEVRLCGGKVFEAGGAFGKLEGKEKVASLGIADFSVWLSELTEIRSADPPIQFKGDPTFLGARKSRLAQRSSILRERVSC
ncbi:MAG: hypothetical protein IPK22_24465 [Verrucomicrobiaceae bacterium]|nr:hypothetical protein [Verrucomicrobiaceae bacterium]